MADADLLGLAVLERDRAGDVLWAWLYPQVDGALRTVIDSKAPLADDSATERFGHFQGAWYYFVTATVPPDSAPALKDVVRICSVVIGKDFNPELYLQAATLFAREYLQAGSPGELLQSYLSLFVKGSCKNPAGGKLILGEFDKRHAYLSGSIKDVVRTFGLEVILLYAAVLLKKRVIFFSTDVDRLLQIVRVAPQFVYKRQDWSMLYPLVGLTEPEINELSGLKHYIAGFTDPSVEEREDLYDLFLNVAAGSVTIAGHAKDTFTLGKVHKEIAMYLTAAAEDQNVSDQDVVKELVSRTGDILAGLRQLMDESTGLVTVAAIKALKMQASMQTFLQNLALAENVLEV